MKYNTLVYKKTEKEKESSRQDLMARYLYNCFITN